MMVLYEASKSKLNANDTYTQVSINALGYVTIAMHVCVII